MLREFRRKLFLRVKNLPIWNFIQDAIISLQYTLAGRGYFFTSKKSMGYVLVIISLKIISAVKMN